MEGLGSLDQGTPFALPLQDRDGRQTVEAGTFGPGSSIPVEPVDDLLLSRISEGKLQSGLPLTYEIEAMQLARWRAQHAAQKQQVYNAAFDEFNMPREPDRRDRKRADWEYTPSAEHKALVLLLYRNILKGLLEFKSVRRRSLIAFTRFAFRRRAAATEKYLIDECIEEARRAVYVLAKHQNFTITKNYEFDAMGIPKDTGQDVRKYMEEVYDPEISRMQFQNFTDVQPGHESEHQQSLSPTSGARHWKGKQSSQLKVEVSEDDKVRRPPPPPDMG